MDDNESTLEEDQEAGTLLELIQADRELLASGLQVPWGLMTAAGAAVAWFVADAATASPGAGYRPSATYLLSAAALLITAYLVQRDVGVRFRNLGARAWAIILGVVVLALAMFSVSLALVSLDLRPLAALPALLTWGVATLGSGAVYRTCVNGLRRG